MRGLGIGVLQGRHSLRPAELGHGRKWGVEGGLSYQPADAKRVRRVGGEADNGAKS